MPLYRFTDQEGNDKFVLACCMAHGVEYWAESERLDLDMQPDEGPVEEPESVIKVCDDIDIIERGGMSLKDKIELHHSEDDDDA